jgi:MinD-like ATPase involved in chromosome partitioning or flagellar assembly
MGLPIVIHQPRADVSKAVLGIADRLIVHTPAPSDSKRRLFKKK